MRLRGAVMIMGATDSGKSTLAGYLINRLLSEEKNVSLVDTDVGQASLGMPGTISLKVFSPGRDIENFLPDKMFFVGAVNPATSIPVVIRVTSMAVEACRQLSEVVLIDTSGLVSGKIGEALKMGKFRAVKPELIVAVQKGDEIEHILNLAGDAYISRIVASGMVKPRDTARRVAYRNKKYEDYFRDVQSTEYLLNVREAELFYKGKTLSPKHPGFPRGNVIGLNYDEETLALGLVTEIGGEWITFRSPLKSLRKINRIVFGEITFRP